MKQIKNFFFLAGGVILPRIASITEQLLEDKNSRLLSYDQRTSIYEAEKELVLGKIPPDLYLEQLDRLVNGSRTKKDLFVELVNYIRVDERALDVAFSLTRTSQVYLFSDYPRTWLQAVPKYMQLVSYFSSIKVIYAAELGLADHFYAVFEKLMLGGLVEPGASLWVDANPFRTSAAIRLGIDAIIFVDERRLRRELNLRKLLG
jgi:hypothetical protein